MQNLLIYPTNEWLVMAAGIFLVQREHAPKPKLNKKHRSMTMGQHIKAKKSTLDSFFSSSNKYAPPGLGVSWKDYSRTLFELRSPVPSLIHLTQCVCVQVLTSKCVCVCEGLICLEVLVSECMCMRTSFAQRSLFHCKNSYFKYAYQKLLQPPAV